MYGMVESQFKRQETQLQKLKRLNKAKMNELENMNQIMGRPSLVSQRTMTPKRKVSEMESSLKRSLSRQITKKMKKDRD